MPSVLDPTYEEDPGDFRPAARPAALIGATVGIVSNGKQGTAPFFDALESSLRTDYGVGDVVRVIKPNYSAPAPPDVIDRAGEWAALIAGIGD